MVSRVIKNYQINMGEPYKVEVPSTQKNNNSNSHITNNSIDTTPEINVDSIYEEAKFKAQKLIDQSQDEAIKIINDANQKAIEIKNQAREIGLQEGYQEGYNKGYQDIRLERNNLITEVEALKHDIFQDYEKYVKGAEVDILNMIMAISKKVIHQEIEMNKEEILLMIKQSIEKCCNREVITLKVSDNDYDIIYENRDKLIATIEGLEKLDIEHTEYLEPGSCLIESSVGTIDASINTKIKKIEDEFNNLITIK